jgi:hypothetical protein
MAAPNVVNVANITGKTAVGNATTVAANLVVNAAASGQLYKLNFCQASNYSASTATANIYFQRSAVNYSIATNISLPTGTTLTIWGKDTAIYLEESDLIQIQASANSAVTITSSYEIIA